MSAVENRPGALKTGLLFCYVFFGLLLSLSLAISVVWCHSQFGEISLEEIAHTLMLPLKGSGTAMMVSGLKRLVASALVSGAAVLFILRVWRRREKRRGLTAALLLGPLVLLVGSGAFAAHKLEAVPFLLGKIDYSSFIDDNYQDARPEEVVFPEVKKNLVVVLVESMEDTFSSGELGRVLTPRLKDLQQKNLSFKKHVQVSGTGWTVAGYTAYLFGLPLKLPLSMDWNLYSRYDTFLPGATSLLEVFEHHGYDVYVIMGTDSVFGGRKNLLRTHSRTTRIFDREYFMAQPYQESDLHSDWGFGDTFLYRQAQNLLTEAAKSERPFLVIIQTLDSHINVDSYENDHIYWQRTDDLAGKFAAWLKKQKFYRDTTTVFVGDHLYMSQHCAQLELPDMDQRTVYNAFLNLPPGLKKAASSDRLFSSFDLAPTLLESVGAELPDGRFGLGVSLFRGQPTLAEKYGPELMNQELRKRSKFYDQLY